MLDELHIQDVALIAQASFAPDAGLTVVTGETGAGKTALLNALKLLIGERADAGLVREGAGELRVEGRFFFAEGSPEGSVVSRRVSVQGRSRAQVDGSLASVKELADIVGQTVDLCGQHEHQRLLSPVYQRELLDAWGAETIAVPLSRYRACLERSRAAQAEIERLRALEQADAVALDRARFALDQIGRVDPQPGEYEALLERMPRLEHGEALVTEANSAQHALTSSGGALERVEAALGALDRIAAVDAAVAPQAQEVRDAYFMLEEAGRFLGSYRDSVDFPREELEEAQERLAQLQGLMRGFGPRMDDVFALRDESQAMLREYEGVGELLAAAEREYSQAEEALADAADALVEAREEVVPRFIAAVSDQMERLEMKSARLEGRLSGLPRESWADWGPHTFELMFASGERAHAQRLGKIASGGEMSRVMLALKVVLGSLDKVDTLVFDEIDAGVGGHAALSLADVLEDLAKTHQVIVVTHLPQVAVRGRVHYLVVKDEGEVPVTRLCRLGDEGRVREVARMLAGEVNDTSLLHARELLGR